MNIITLKSKISYAKITDSNLFYEGSITIPIDMLEKANIAHNEQVHVVNVNNGERLVTYAIEGERGSDEYKLNGPAARKGLIGDEVIIIAYASIDPQTESLDPIVIDLKHHDH
ncbi:aspartate 1-decarboxylase [Candidatus Marinamargulisbacteria bacterium SCGC AG-343-D04]|nr:aspartate 1-decarboxylase [Candidatus Marinamargulisbacteria bacterium SCGC AG-343-D04]